MDNAQRNITSKVRQLILDSGFSDVGIVRAEPLSDCVPAFRRWLENGFNGGMSFMNNYFEKRIDPSLLTPGARSVVVAIMNYYPERKQPENVPQVAKYAYGRDYHKVLKNKLRKILSTLENEEGISGRVFVDSAPLLEKPLGEKAGLGWIGKNACLIGPRFGSFFVMGEMVIDAELDYDQPGVMACGTCMKCIEACPTNAIVEPGVVNAEKCLSYLTIEKKDDDITEVDSLHNRIFGCDTCQDVCPWNKKSKPHDEPDFEIRNNLDKMNISDWDKLTPDSFTKNFAGTALMRPGFKGIMRSLEMLKNQK